MLSKLLLPNPRVTFALHYSIITATTPVISAKSIPGCVELSLWCLVCHNKLVINYVVYYVAAKKQVGLVCIENTPLPLRAQAGGWKASIQLTTNAHAHAAYYPYKDLLLAIGIIINAAN